MARYHYAILDRDSIFNVDVIAFLKATGFEPKRTSIKAPWRNGTAERWIGSWRREILDHIIPINKEHLLRLIRDYVCYHHEGRIHNSLKKDTPNRRVIEPRPTTDAGLISLPLGRAPPSPHVATSGIETVAGMPASSELSPDERRLL